MSILQYIPGSVVLQFALLTEGPTCRTGELPPEPHPLASDIEAIKFFFVANGICVWKEPRPLLKLDDGIDTVRGVPNS